MTADEATRLIGEAMKPFLFKKVTPNLIARVEDALRPLLEAVFAQAEEGS